MKIIRKSLVILFIVIFVLCMLFVIWQNVMSYQVSSTPVYWVVIVGWVFIITNYNLASSTSIFLAIILFIVGVSLSVLGIWSISEIFMQLSIIGVLLGAIQALWELKKRQTRRRNI